MAFTEVWAETEPDGAVRTVSLADDYMREIKRAVRERLEGNPTDTLSGIYESGTFGATAIVKAGSARASTPANAAGVAALTVQNGRLAITLDQNRMHHVRASGAVEIPYLWTGGGTVTGVLSLTGGGSLTTNAQITTTLGTGSQPFVVSSTTMNPNLNADLVDGQHAAAFAAAAHTHLRADLPAPVAYEDENNIFIDNQKFTGRVGIGTAIDVASQLVIADNGSVNQALEQGLLLSFKASDGSTATYGAQIQAYTRAAAFTCAILAHLKLPDAVKGAGSTITVQYGIKIDDQTKGTANYSIYSGTAQSRFGGKIMTMTGANGGPYAIHAEADSGVGIYWPSGGMGVHGTFFVDGPLTGQWFSQNTNGDASNPSLRWEADSDNGLYRIGANDWAMTCGGVTVMEFDTDNTAQGTRMKIYDNTAAAVVRVSRGATDSGGAGFKVLRVPN